MCPLRPRHIVQSDAYFLEAETPLLSQLNVHRIAGLDPCLNYTSAHNVRLSFQLVKGWEFAIFLLYILFTI